MPVIFMPSSLHIVACLLTGDLIRQLRDEFPSCMIIYFSSTLEWICKSLPQFSSLSSFAFSLCPFISLTLSAGLLSSSVCFLLPHVILVLGFFSFLLCLSLPLAMLPSNCQMKLFELLKMEPRLKSKLMCDYQLLRLKQLNMFFNVQWGHSAE